jgi:hypothetical protein
MSLLTVCQTALEELSGFEVPTSFYGNPNLTAVLCVRSAEAGLGALEIEHRWQELISEYTFTTSAGVATYALPDGFRAFANLAMWDRTNQWRMYGPVPSMIWQWIKSGITVAAANRRWYMVRGNLLTIFPTPTVTGDTIAYDYYSKYCVLSQSTGGYLARFSSDNDLPRLDERLLTLDVKWRFLSAKGMPFEANYKEFEAVKEDLWSDNGGKPLIDMNGGINPVMNGNIPDTGFGG